MNLKDVIESITETKTAMHGLKDMFGFDLFKVLGDAEPDAPFNYEGITAKNLRMLIDYIYDFRRELDHVEERIVNAVYDIEHIIDDEEE